MLGFLRNRGVILRGAQLVSNRTNTGYAFCFLQLSRFGEFCTSKLKGEAKGRSYSNEVEGPTEIKKTITKGDVINLHDLLFTKSRDYLVRYQDNQQVKAEHLVDKVILIYFMPIGNTHNLSYRVPLLEHLYIDLLPRNFEVVSVPVNMVDHEDVIHKDTWKQFEQLFPLMPWPAIPLSDIPSMKSLQRKGFSGMSTIGHNILIIDSTGMVLQCDWWAYNILDRYGALGYPFSDERIKYLGSEEDAIVMQPSLQTLLASPQRDYVISNKGDKVPIHTLEDKVVALYFYEDGISDDLQLKKAYKELTKSKKNFEVVLIYVFDYKNISSCTKEESFWKTFKTMPWLALPFKDPAYKRLKRILEYPTLTDHQRQDKVPSLVIFGPRGEFIDPFGARIVNLFGIRGYPFTCAKIVNLEIEKTKDMRLEMLWNQNTVFTGYHGSKVPFSQLYGKRVIIFLERYRLDSADIEFLKMLKKMYLLCKGSSDEFEVIQIIEREESSSASNFVGYLPWLGSLATELLPGALGFFSVHGHNSFNSFAFFDGHGKLVRKTIWPCFESENFPFCKHGLEEEAWTQLRVLFDWRSWYESSSWSSIYSLQKINAPASLRVFKC